MRKIILISLLLTYVQMNAQVGIGTPSPDNGSMLDVTATDKGMLVPRVNIANLASISPITGSTTTSLLVYNTNTTTGTGFYYWDNAITRWVKIDGGKDWSLTGNAGTTAGTNFIGTTDNVELRLRTNNTDRIRISNNGNVGINIAPSAYKLDVDSGTADAIFGHSSNVGGALGYESNITFGVSPQTLNGTGIYASNPAAGYTSIFAQSTGSATVAASINYSNVWMSNYNYVDNASSTSNPSVSYNQLNNTSTTLGGTQIAVRGFNNRGTTSGNPGYSVGVQGLSNSQNQDSYGIQGLSFCDAGISTGGYFSGNNYAGTNIAYAYVGGWINGSTARKIIGTGTVSEIVPTEKHGRVTLTCPESPEYWYQDYGTVEMINGKATIYVDEILADIIIVDEENPLRVICTPVGMPYFNGITIMSQTKNSVEILELNGGNHSGKLQYQLVAKPKTNYGEGRFPQAPGPGYLKSEKEPISSKAKNQPADGRNIFKWPADHIVYKYNPEDYVSVGDVIPAGTNAGKIKLGNGKYGYSVPAELPKK